MSSSSMLRAIAVALCASTLACSGALRRFPLSQPMWRDEDRRPFVGEPEPYFSPFGWDAVDQTLFRPLSRVLAVDPAGTSVNVNALDEVPDSSWFQNRIGGRPVSPAALARGPCRPPETDPVPPWTVTGAKPNGANPGFVIEDAQGRRYLAKFDGLVQGPRATAADVMVSKLYWAAGYTVPCNQVVFFEESMLRIAPDASGESPTGEKEPLTRAHVDAVLDKAIRLPDGRYRASTSLFLRGKPLGPFTYQGTRADDPNDVVPHEDRRELRGSRVLGAWVNHFDAREQNTLDMWVSTGGGRGYIQHDLIDFGDCLGSIWEPPLLGRRIGHASYLDVGYVAEDFVTLGLQRRPWDGLRFGPSGRVFAYFDVETFEPELWRPGYPNPAFSRMQEGDAAWMTRIIARFSDAHLRTLAKVARFGDLALEAEIVRLLQGRRDRILHRYFSVLSPLSQPRVSRVRQGAELCLRDLAVASGAAVASSRLHVARGWRGPSLANVGLAAPRASGPDVCVRLPDVGGSAEAPVYVVVDVTAGDGARSSGPARVHLYALGRQDYRVVGLERPELGDPPG